MARPLVTSCGLLDAEVSMLSASLDAASFDASSACGGCVEITSGGVSVNAVVVGTGAWTDPTHPVGVAVGPALLARLLPGGATFAQSGVSWRYAACPVDMGPMTFMFQVGSNPSYAAVTIRNHRYRLAAVAFRGADGGYIPLTRTAYNFWVAPMGMGAGPFTLRLTDVNGQQVEQSDIPLAPEQIFRGRVQFPECTYDSRPVR